MNAGKISGNLDTSEEISALIDALHRAEQRLEHLTGGEVDTVADRHGRTLLLRQAQEAMRHSHADKQAAILNALPVPTALLDPNGLIISVNEAWRKFDDADGQYSPGQELGVNYLALCDQAVGTDSSDAHQIARGVRSVLMGEAPNFSIEYLCGSHDQDRWFLMTVTTITDARASGAIIMHLNITERRQDAEALRAGGQRQRQLADQLEMERARLAAAQRIAKVGSWETDLATMDVVWSEEIHRMFETDKATFHPTHERFLEFVHPEDRTQVAEAFDRSLGERAAYKVIEHRLLMADGRIKFVEERWRIFFAGGKPARAVGTCQDITERKQAEEKLYASEARFRQMADNIDDVFFLRNAEGDRMLYLSPAFEKIWGRSCESVYADQESWADSIHPDDFATAYERYREGLSSKKAEYEYRIVRPDGVIRWIRTRSFPVREDVGKTVRVAGIAQDVTEFKEQERKLARLNRLRAVIGGISSAMLRQLDRETLLQEACRVATTEGVIPMAWVSVPDPQTGKFKIVTLHAEDPGNLDIMRTLYERESWALQDRPSYRAAKASRPVVINDIGTDPTMAPVSAELLRCGYRSTVALPLFVEGTVDAILVLLAGERDFFDAEEMSLLEWMAADLSFALNDLEKSQRLDYLAYYDALTGLPNLQLFRDRLDQLIHEARQEQGKVCLVVVDLERFTQINDTHGRSSGDELLRQVGSRFQECLVKPYALGRIAADTFAAASPGNGEIVSTQLRDRMLAALRQPFHIDGGEVGIDAQAGIALFPDDGSDSTSIFKNAEAALKLAKSTGERYSYYSSEMNARVAGRLALEKQLRTAIDTEQFVLHYQPKVDMISGDVVGAEALIRWQHPDKGLVAPAEFIALAEETGLIVPLGTWVIKTVCAQQAAWIAAGLRAVPIAVNLSSPQFDNNDLLQTVRNALETHSLDARLLDLELTESAMMIDSGAAATTLQALRALGVGLALDDFGTGYSSLAHLKRFPFNSVKIDRSFVTDITHNVEDAAIATAIIAIAHSLNFKVVAEGVETQGQLNYLRAHGCDQMQGNYFSPAVPRDIFESDLRTGRRMQLPVSAPADQRTLLLVDDEPHISAALSRMLRPDGYRILTATGGSQGLEILALNSVQVIISDQRMPGMAGTEFLNTVKQLYPDTVRIILSGYTDLAVVTDAVNRGSVFKFLTKPWDDNLLREQVRDAFRRYQPESDTSHRHSKNLPQLP